MLFLGMNNKCLPDKFAAVGAKGWLSEECSHELVTIYLVHTPSHGSTPPVEALPFLEFPRLGLCKRDKMFISC